MAQPPRGIGRMIPRAGGGLAVQLAALNTAAAAQRDWDQLTTAHPLLFADTQPRIETAAVNGRIFYRLRTGAFTTATTATRFCEKLTEAGCDCTIADF
jgi:hypothetical protein